MTDDPEMRAAAQAFAERLVAGDVNAFADWFATRSGEPPAVAWSPSPDQLAPAQLRFLLAHWNGLRGARAMPGRSEISPLDLVIGA